MTGKELDELEKLIAELRSAWDGKAVYHVSLLEAVHKTATPQLLTSLIAAARERDALREQLKQMRRPLRLLLLDTRDRLEQSLEAIERELPKTERVDVLTQHRGEAGKEVDGA